MLGIVLGLKKVGGPAGGAADISDGLRKVGVETGETGETDCSTTSLAGSAS